MPASWSAYPISTRGRTGPIVFKSNLQLIIAHRGWGYCGLFSGELRAVVRGKRPGPVSRFIWSQTIKIYIFFWSVLSTSSKWELLRHWTKKKEMDSVPTHAKVLLRKLMTFIARAYVCSSKIDEFSASVNVTCMSFFPLSLNIFDYKNVK